ncbi:Uncharacterized protein At4g26485 [Linum perenne]
MVSYSSSQKILLVGEGDFSFSASLAISFGSSAPNIVATSLDSQEFLRTNYKKAMDNIAALRARCCVVLHELDATTMACNCYLSWQKFDRIVFNFPFAGFFKEENRESQIRKHQNLIRMFMENAKKMITETGEIHITHKTVAKPGGGYPWPGPRVPWTQIAKIHVFFRTKIIWPCILCIGPRVY